MTRDFRYAVRMLLKSPAFTIIAILAIALGIGATTVGFSAINALLLRPFPLLQDQDRLVHITQYLTKLGDQDADVAFPDYLEWRKQTQTLEGIGAVQEATFIVSDGDVPARYLGAKISADTFAMLGVQPIMGRHFRSEEDDLNAPPVALLGYHVWQNHFGGDPEIVGRVVPINGKQATVVGVMPKGWRFPEICDIWMPLQFSEEDNPRGQFFLETIAKLKPGVSIAQARAELEAINARIAAQYPDTNAGMGVRMTFYRDEAVSDARTLTLLVMGAVLFVHLIACANVANLLLARAATRTKEIAVRLALGAARRHVVRQLLAESAVLGLAGSALGLLFAIWGVDLMVTALPNELPYWLNFDLDGRVFGFAVGMGLLSSVAFGLVPALQSSRPQLVDVLKEGGRSGGGSVKGQRIRNALVVAEVALALILLVGAGLMMRSFMKLQQTNLGVDTSNVLTFRVGLPESQFPDEAVAGRFFEQLIPRLTEVQGVDSAGATTSLPATGLGTSAFVIEGEPEPARLQDARLMGTLSVTPGFVEAMRIALVRGRSFTAADNKDATRVAMIDEAGAAAWFPNQDPIGRQLRVIKKLGEEPVWATIVGIVKPVAYSRLTRKRTNFPVTYFAHAQTTPRFMSVAMRTKTDPKSFVNIARSTVLEVNRELPIYRIATMDEVIAESYWDRKFFGSLFTIFACLALFLASLGLYGVMSYSVRQRTQEIGVRMALGAQAADVLRMVTGQGMRLIGLGLLIGFAGAFFLMKLLVGSLHGVSAHDPLSFGLVGLILAIVGFAACYLPARSAMRLDPMIALRYE